jgi:hypothetical protein
MSTEEVAAAVAGAGT